MDVGDTGLAAGFHHAEGRAQPPNLIRSGPNRLMHALVRFAHIAAGNTFTTAEIHPAVLEALGCAPECYTLASLRYDRSKLRAKGLVAKLPHSRRYQLLPQGYSICLVFLKLFERVYAPLTAGLLNPWHSIARGDPDPRGLCRKTRELLRRRLPGRPRSNPGRRRFRQKAFTAFVHC